MLGSLDVPLRQSEDTPDTFAIDRPSEREKITRQEPTHESAGQQVPALADSVYGKIPLNELDLDQLEVLIEVVDEYWRTREFLSVAKTTLL